MNKPRQYHSDLASLLLGIEHVPSALNTQIHGLVSDSRAVKQGDLFIALAGHNSNAEVHVHDAIKRGAAAVLIDCDAKDQEKDRDAHEDGHAVELYIPNLRKHVGEIAHRFFHRPSEELEVIGVTGTNGKTSVVNYIAQFFASVGLSTAVIGTLGYGMCAQGETLIETNHTTPDVVDVHRYLAHLRDAGAELVAMEVSSHGLTQGRVEGVRFSGAVFTNLSRDHLDYHQSMDDYAEAKARLFAWESLRYVVVNVDDEYASKIFQKVLPETRKIRISTKADAEVSVQNVKYGEATQAVLNVGVDTLELNSPLLGEFNLYNLLCVLGVALARKNSTRELSNINFLTSVAGRLETFAAPDRPLMVVDYAHTPDALENVLKTLKPLCNGRLITVFGCGGDRDKGKRREMGLLAREYSSFSVITSDNPRTEDPKVILSNIESAFGSGDPYALIEDREQAIRYAFEHAEADDVILVAGKGHENYQEVNGERHYFSDADCCRALLGLEQNQAQRISEGEKQ